MRKMDDFGPLVALAARDRAAFRLTHYAQDLAALFHSFYTNCHVINEEPALRDARLALVDATRIVLALSLGLLGRERAGEDVGRRAEANASALLALRSNLLGSGVREGGTPGLVERVACRKDAFESQASVCRSMM